MSIFISYSHQDQEIVEKIAKNLVKKNIHIWIDKWELNYGDSLIQKIQEAITESSILLIMLSKASVESEWCKKELSAGLMRELEEKRVIVIPVVLETCSIPIFLKEKYYADFREDFDKSMRKLQDSLLEHVDITLNRVQSNKYLIDWAVDYGIKDDSFFLNCNTVSFCDEYEYSVICLLEITGNEKVKKLYKKSLTNSIDHFFINDLINSLSSLDKNNDLRILLEDNHPKHSYFGLKDPKLGYEFNVHFYISRVGKNTGFDLLFDFGSIIRLMSKQREEILRK